MSLQCTGPSENLDSKSEACKPQRRASSDLQPTQCLTVVILENRDASAVEGRVDLKWDGADNCIWVEVECFGLNSSPNQLYFPQSFCHWGEFKLAG